MKLKVIANDALFIALYSIVAISIFSTKNTRLTVKYFIYNQYNIVVANVLNIEHIGKGSTSLGSKIYVEFEENGEYVSTSFEQLGYLMDKKTTQFEVLVCKSNKNFVTSKTNLLIESIRFIIAVFVFILLIKRIIKIFFRKQVQVGNTDVLL